MLESINGCPDSSLNPTLPRREAGIALGRRFLNLPNTYGEKHQQRREQAAILLIAIL